MTTELSARAKDLETARERAHELYKKNLIERMKRKNGT
jgi:hypothetical protein